MTKIKSLFTILCISIVLYACDQDLNTLINPFENVDYEALAISDNDTIVTFLKSHYYDSDSDAIKTIDAGQISLNDDGSRLHKIPVTNNNIDYTLYVYVTRQGINSSGKNNPTELDSVFVNRTGARLLNNSISSTSFDSATQTWWSLGNTLGISGIAPSPILGWTKGFPKFTPGDNVTNNGPLTFENTGKGYIFIPSGLAYPSINFQPGQNPNALRYDQILVFKVELLDFVKDTDHDNDGVASINEDANKDQDPTNDFSDPSLPNLPDYLNPNY